MNERIIQREETRESYSAPTYQVFSFETSDLMQTSGEQPVVLKGAFLGKRNDASTAVFVAKTQTGNSQRRPIVSKRRVTIRFT